MGLLDRLRGRSERDVAERALQAAAVRVIPLPEDHFMKVVGESHYQEALRALAGQCDREIEGRPSFRAVLVAEPDNVHDRHAIAVYGPTGQLGYLARDDAVRYVGSFAALRQAGYDGGSCTGLLNGGDRDRPNFGVVLMLAYPETCEMHLGISSGSTRTGAQGTGASKSAKGRVRGKHYTEYVEQLKTLRRQGEDGKAEELLFELVGAVETEAATEGWGVAPWYYEQLAIIYRQRKDPRSEVAILERYAAAHHAPGVGPKKLRQRLEKARQLLDQAER